MKAFPFAFFFSVACLVLARPAPAQSPESPAERALRELKTAATPKPPTPPAPGKKKPQQLHEGERKAYAAALAEAVTKARVFQATFPQDPNLAAVRKIEVISLLKVVRTGDAAREKEALQLADTFAADGRNSRRDRFIVASTAKQWAVQKRGLTDRAALFAEYEKNATALYADFADVPDVYHLFLGLARNAPTPAKAREVAADLLAKAAPPEVKTEAQAVIDRLKMPGKKLELKFVVNDGSEFELAKHKGTAVVVYFWTSSADEPTKRAMAAIRTAASATRASFVGVNLDPGSTTRLLAPDGQPPPGPQHWTPVGINGPVPRQLRVNQVPSVYVFNAEGILQGFGPPATLPTLLAAAGAAPVSRQTVTPPP